MDRQSGRKIWKIAEFYNELMFRVPALEQAVRHKGRTYNYYWTMPGADNMMSACHAMELSYVFINPQVTIYTGGLYNGKLADTVQDMWVNFARTGDPSTAEYFWEPYTADSRKTMVLGEKIGMTEDLKAEQRALIEPLLHHYFNGCYMQMDLNVPQLYRIIAQIAATLLLFVAAEWVIRKHRRSQIR